MTTKNKIDSLCSGRVPKKSSEGLQSSNCRKEKIESSQESSQSTS